MSFYALDVGLGVATPASLKDGVDCFRFYALDVGLGVATYAGFERL